MIWQNYSEIRKDLSELRNHALGLSEEMKTAAERLQAGGIGPSPDLMNELETYRNSFQQITMLIGKSSSLKDDELKSIDSIEALEEVVENQEARQQSLDVIDSVLGITHPDGDDFEALRLIQSGASELRGLISRGDRLLSDEDLQRRITDYQVLVDMVSKSNDMTDGQWDSAFDRITTTFGRTLSTAVVRGRLSMDIMA